MEQPRMSQIVTTASISEDIDQITLRRLLDRHFEGDWGTVGSLSRTRLTPLEIKNRWSQRDCGQNALAVNKITDGRVLSSYQIRSATIWVITSNWADDEEQTTVLYPSEY